MSTYPAPLLDGYDEKTPESEALPGDEVNK